MLIFGTLKGYSDGIEEARHWALYVKKEKEISVLSAEIESNDFLDLCNCVEHRKLYDKVLKIARALHSASKYKDEDFNDWHVFIRIKENNSIDFIRAFVNAAKDTGHIVRRPQIQICVINKSCIKNMQLVCEERS
ncbi:hypothetical protein [Treponema phagedenis]|uniref:Uncharacterized protein n=1 Tax=Treponema phagedenis TaxID=162 RepID=A0AAE6M949_TREPH|nr:hypothetical protein [Treponema phagedenis]QEJ94686.1 hypothetical protein FUT79_05345 [Treponema phagedenis]QEJ98627.1 hypothetical protein FUT82_11870 [Treponema phagedenis]QEJ99961.1 hypothetical protein FUT84_01375 [Treponema phagedenis]QEK04134.1 hypothetical protein FUT83_10175 [Treponema phagedenis]QEK05290.1 hypothetical protein FUT80_00135 [Treponema phagedenis]